MRRTALALAFLVLTACSGAGDDTRITNAELEAEEEPLDTQWQANATAYRDRIGARIAYTCPPQGELHTVWGVSPYTDDSSVCTAAVHAGLITAQTGGRVVFEMTEGQQSYEGGEANGVTTSEWPDWPGSFVFPSSS